MNPYDSMPDGSFWRRAVSERDARTIDYDLGRKFTFSVNDKFATGGSCFAQHFGRELKARGGTVIQAETFHPLMAGDVEHGFDLFPARYGNIYTVRQLRELLEQATGQSEMVADLDLRSDGRLVDMLRPRAVPEGFTTKEEALRDREYHLACVRNMIQEMTVFVFTLGLTEAWINSAGNYVYSICPGAVAGKFDESLHQFRNFSYEECLADMRQSIEIVRNENPQAKVLLTVSPVMLVATAETRNVLVSSIASKSILRAVADSCTREFDFVDYFPSFEIISGPQATGSFWAKGMRDVNADGVSLVMDVFFKSRLPELADVDLIAGDVEPTSGDDTVSAQVAAALDVECEEILLDRKDVD